MKRFFIETQGCQMNKADSERIAGMLIHEGWVEVSVPEDADLVLVNGCAVREKAELRAVRRAREYQRINDTVRVGLIGCAAEWTKSSAGDLLPDIYLTASPARLYEIPVLAERGGHATGDDDWRPDTTRPERTGGIRAWIPVMRGCDQWCSYCVVPTTRGKQISFPVDYIVQMARDALSRGYAELVLLGQRVSAYRYDGCNFECLISHLEQLPGLRRLRFTAPYPSDISESLLRRMGSSPVVEHRLHLPLQSGSNRILSRMNRGYTIEQYRDLVVSARRIVPDLGLSTDLIVGFPGETAYDFEETVRAVEDLAFDTAFTFAYSERSDTAAAHMDGQVEPAVKRERLKRLIDVHHRILTGHRERYPGKETTMIVEGLDKKQPDHSLGKTSSGIMVILQGEYPIGSEIAVKIVGLRGHTLIGVPLG